MGVGEPDVGDDAHPPVGSARRPETTRWSLRVIVVTLICFGSVAFWSGVNARINAE